MSSEVLSLRVDQRLLKRLTKAAARAKLTKSEMGERILAVGLDEWEHVEKTFRSPVVGAMLRWMTADPQRFKALAMLAGEHTTIDEARDIVAITKNITRGSSQDESDDGETAVVVP
jgi:hypothetical protein